MHMSVHRMSGCMKIMLPTSMTGKQLFLSLVQLPFPPVQGCLSVHSQSPWWRLSFHLSLNTIFAKFPMILIFMFVVWLFLSPNYNTTNVNSRTIQSWIKWKKKKNRRDWSCQRVFNKITLKLFIFCLYSLRWYEALAAWYSLHSPVFLEQKDILLP